MNGITGACRDYRYLLDRGYPEKASVKLVGDRYRLSKSERTILYRGVSSLETSVTRKSRVLDEVPPDATLLVDGHNVLFTVVNYLTGHPLFIGTDGLLRDAGGAHGRFPNRTVLDTAVHRTVSLLHNLALKELLFYLDEPIPFSRRLAGEIREALEQHASQNPHRSTPAVECPVVQSADGPLRRAQRGIVATSDSAVIDATALPIFDLARRILESHYSPEFLQIDTVLGS
jgi:hypothetical protein